MAQASDLANGAILDIVKSDNGYKVTQKALFSSLPSKPDGDSRQDFEVDLGPVKITGWIDISIPEVHVEIYVLGIKIGTYNFNPNDGFTIEIDLFLAKGLIKFYVKDNCLYVHIEVSVTFDGSWDQDIQIICW